MNVPENKKPKGIGLALGGGGVRACIYIGFYEVLRENDIPISCVAGTSMGAIIGACMALEYPPEMIKDFVTKIEDLDLLSFNNFNFLNESLLKREKISELLDILFGGKTFKDFKIPFLCTSIDLEERNTFVLNEGIIARAVEASSAYPLLFPPVLYNSRYLIDGGILNNVPSTLARTLSDSPIVAVRIKNNIVRQYISGQIFKRHLGKNKKDDSTKLFGLLKKKKEDLKFLLDIILDTFSIATDSNVNRDLEKSKPELLLEPTIDIGLLDFSKVEDAIVAGRKLALENLEKIKVLIK